MIKKITSPIIYSLFTIPVLIITFGSWDLFGKIGFHLFWNDGRAAIANLVFLISAFGVFYFGNAFINNKFEKIKEHRISDHLRQSSIFYFIFVYQIFKGFPGLEHIQFISCSVDCDDFITAATIALIPLVAIISNGLYILKKRRG